MESPHPLIFERESNVVHIDADVAQTIECRFGILDPLVDGLVNSPVVFEERDGGLGERVDGVGANQVVDVQRVRIVRILRRCRGPERSLNHCSTSSE